MTFDELLANEDVQKGINAGLVDTQTHRKSTARIWFSCGQYEHIAYRDGEWIIRCHATHPIGGGRWQFHVETVAEWLAALRERLEEK